MALEREVVLCSVWVTQRSGQLSLFFPYLGWDGDPKTYLFVFPLECAFLSVFITSSADMHRSQLSIFIFIR